MKIINILQGIVIITLFVGFTSCKKDETKSISENQYYGSYIGKYLIIGLIGIKDTIDVRDDEMIANNSDGKISLYSHLLKIAVSGQLNDKTITISNAPFSNIPLNITDTILSASTNGSGVFVDNKLTFDLNVVANTNLDNPLDSINAPVTGTFTK